MKARLTLLEILFFLLINFFAVPSYIYADPPFVNAPSCQSKGISTTFSIPQPIPEGQVFDITFKTVDPGNYQFQIGFGPVPFAQVYTTDSVPSSDGSVTLRIGDSNVLQNRALVGGNAI